MRLATLRFPGFAVFLALGLMASPAAARLGPCEATPARHAVRFGGEVSGAHAFSEMVGRGWTFTLVPATYGWDVRLNDANGFDLSQITPPFRLAPNPREIYGWHFRNAANTGANKGDVNAPQRERRFIFSPSLTGTGGFKPPPPGAPPPSPEDMSTADGYGWIDILDYGLADLDPGQKARMVYLKFDACLIWSKTEDESRLSEGLASPLFSPAEKEMMAACGLDQGLELDAWLSPHWLTGDFDGDGALDHAAPVARRTDGKRGIAICRAGTWLDMIGLAERIGEHLEAAYFDRADWWRIEARGPVSVGGEGGEPPVLAGDAITIGKGDSSSVMIYWDGRRWTSYWQGD